MVALFDKTGARSRITRFYMTRQIDHKRILGNEKGMVLAVTLMLIAALVLLGTTAVTTVTTDLKIASNYRQSQIALYNAEAGVETVIAYLRTNSVSYPTAKATQTIIDGGTCPTANACPSVSCTCTQISVPPPTGFSFSSTVKIYGYDMTKRLYLFRMTGTGDNNASKTIEAVIKKFSSVPMTSDGAVAMYGGGPAVQFKVGAGGGYAVDGHDYPVPPSATCNGSACDTTATALPAVPGLFTVMSPTITGNVGAHLEGNPDQTLGPSRETEYNDFVNNVITNNLYQTTLGTRANPAVTVIPNLTTLNASGNGAGIIIVDNGGALNINGNFEYEGLVILRGTGRVFGAGTANIFGSMVTIGHLSKLIDLTGGVNLFYSSSALANISNINSSANTTARTAWRDVL